MKVNFGNQQYIFECVTCGKHFQPNEALYLCPSCSKQNTPDLPPKGILKVIYNYDHFRIMNQFSLLPVNDHHNMPNLRIGQTPLYKFNAFFGKKLPYSLYVKDDSQNPTFSFKDRASALVSAIAREKGIDTIITASTGNAGSSLAGICAANNQKAIVVVPESAPVAKLSQIMMYGASIIPVKGTYDQAFDLSVEASDNFGWYNRNTAYNPFTIEGKKTVSFEIYDQLDQEIPDNIFVPVGDGVIISGVYKGFEDLLKLKLIDKMPRIIGVQAKGSDNLSRNYKQAEFKIKPSKTIADSISVDVPRNFYMARDFIKKYKGDMISVADQEILNASKLLSEHTGIFTEPASAAAFAGYLKFHDESSLPANSKNVVLLTGCGLKDIKAVNELISLPPAINPDIAPLKDLVND